MYQIVLASESPRRKEIMETMGIPFMAMASNVEEVVSETEPEAMVKALADLKAKDIADKIEKKQMEDVIVIGADTMVFFHGTAMGKPKDEEDAKRMIQLLSGEEHQVYTGVSIIIKDNQKEERKYSFAVCTKVIVQPLNQKQIDDYVATKEPMDKAGAYGIQGGFGIHIKEINGDYYNVVGFPISKIYEVLLNHGIDIKNLIEIKLN